MFVELATEAGETAGIDGFDAEAMYVQGSVQNDLSVTSLESAMHSIAR